MVQGMSFVVLLVLGYTVMVVKGLATAPNPTVVLITGCSSGIGQSAAVEFSKHSHYKVWATMRDIAKSKLPSDLPNLIVLPLDVTQEDSVGEAVAHILKEDGHIDLLVNNAGYGMAGCLETVSVEEAKSLFEVNVWGVVRLLQAVLPSMRKQRRGYIINISSTSGIRGIPCFEFYTGSKFALEGITDSMRYSLTPFNISVTNINAGPVRTSFSQRFGDSEAGGKGTRRLNDDANGDFMHWYTDGMVSALNQRMASEEAQDVSEIGQLLVNLHHLQSRAKRPTDVPFNIGSNYESQKLLEDVRKQPTGWGGVYSEILARVPQLPRQRRKSPRSDL